MSFLQRLRERFWFVPTVLCVTALVVAETLVAVDERLDADALPSWLGTLVYRVGESGSRDLLGAIATSSLGVAGTTFSITMAVLALTSSSYGPRLVRNFMADRGNQAVLGVFVATFLYCVIVLRSIRVLGDPTATGADAFVPYLAVNLAMVLAVVEVAVLVYFIHHISDSIQVSTLTRGVRRELATVVDLLYPADVGDGPAAARPAGSDGPGEARRELPAEVLAQVLTDGTPVLAGATGYVRGVDGDRLLRLAADHGVIVALRCVPGRFLLPDDVVAVVHPADRVDGTVRRAVRRAVDVADARTPAQDVAFAVQQLTEMAVRALSPGTNDPYTAVNALDDLSAGLAALVARELPSPWRRDRDGVPRVHAPQVEPADLVRTVLDHLRWYASDSPSVMRAGLDLLERVGTRARDGALRAVTAGSVDLLEDAFRAAGHHPHDVAAFAARATEVRSRLAGPGPG